MTLTLAVACGVTIGLAYAALHKEIQLSINTTVEAADVDGDGDVDLADLGIVAPSINTNPPEDERADLDKNEVVDISDLAVVGRYFQGGSPNQGLPPFPILYSGTVFIQGEEAPEGLSLVACVLDCATGWESQAVMTLLGGEYNDLVVSPPDKSFLMEVITFWIVNEFGRIQATETLEYEPDPRELAPILDLHFADPVPTPPAPKTVESDLINETMEDLTIFLGATVTWTNRDLDIHTTTSGRPEDPEVGTLWDSSILNKGDTFSFTFTAVGNFPYFCQVHPDTMQATVTVTQ